MGAAGFLYLLASGALFLFTESDLSVDALARVSDGTRMLTEAKTAFDALKIADAAEAYRYVMKLAGGSEEAQRKASELKLRAERRAGELLREMPETRGGDQKSQDRTFDPKPGTYAEQGIDKRVAARCQKIADIPEEKFEEFLAVADEITNTGIIRVANEIDRFSEKSAPELPATKYRVLYADPPWRYGREQHGESGEVQDTVLASHYSPMSIENLCALPVCDLCERDAVLFLWVTSPQLENAFSIIRTWGFEYKTSMVWDKVKHNVGNYVSVRHEFLLICTRGSCTPDVKKLIDSVYSEERTEHSQKPEYFREIIDMLYPHGRAIELFRRGPKIGRWDVWGDEAK